MKKTVVLLVLGLVFSGCSLLSIFQKDGNKNSGTVQQETTIPLSFYVENEGSTTNTSPEVFASSDNIKARFEETPISDSSAKDTSGISANVSIGERAAVTNVSLVSKGSNEKGTVFEFSVFPHSLDAGDESHWPLIEMIGALAPGQHEVHVRTMYRTPAAIGSFKWDLTNGKGRFDELIAAVETRKQQIIEDYNNSQNFVSLTLINKSSKVISIVKKTGHRLTDSEQSVSANSKLDIKARPGDVLLRGETEIITVTSEGEGEIDITPPPFIVKHIETVYGGDDAWKSWRMETNRGNWEYSTVYGGDDAWKSWNVNTEDGKWSISTMYGGDDAWKQWRVSGEDGQFEISTVYSGDDAWKQWRVSGEGASIEIRTVYSGDDAWKQWRISGADGNMEIQTEYSGDDGWKSWRVGDELKQVPTGAKIAAVFACLVPSLTRNSSTPKAACAMNGHQLYGKVKIVDYSENLKVKYVDYSEDIRVQFVEYGADSCGEWELVEYGEDFTIKIVDYGEDIKVKKVDYNPGI